VGTLEQDGDLFKKMGDLTYSPTHPHHSDKPYMAVTCAVCKNSPEDSDALLKSTECHSVPKKKYIWVTYFNSLLTYVNRIII
jgi:hypothetical protein